MLPRPSGWLALAAILIVPTGPAKGDAGDHFETRVRPLLLKRCVSCHGETIQQGGLRLDRSEFFRKGGGRGALLDSSNPEKSLLLQVVSGAHSSLRMPPSGPLANGEVETLRTWVRAGAPWPEIPKTAASTPEALWSVRLVKRPSLPKVRNTSWIRTPVDAFVLSRLEREGLRPAPIASRRTLIRRVMFDLTGLPPTAAEIERFENDPDPHAYERLVGRLLTSPRYGERWARHWLDLVRYADTNGYERDAAKPYAWKYRDYVIRSLNADKPFDRFLTEQLAGDELPNRTEETVVATGFLRLGTWDDEPNDPLDYKYERLDDLVHTTSSAFLGLTVRCARCHDHKFDPISQKDYYRLAAAFWPGYTDPGPGDRMGGPPKDRLPFEALYYTDRTANPPPIRLLKNGDPRKEMEAVEPGYLALLANLEREAVPPVPGAETSGRRLQLARWIADPANPLTPRVLANRVWLHHFGQGLVRTPNNFGSKGDPPSHPELLDWLASEVIAKGWRLKSLHRVILLSNTYRMASVHPHEEVCRKRDASNRLLWRQFRRRLDADTLRDRILAASGELDLREGGPGFVPSATREALEGLSRKGAEWNPSPPAEQRRRSIYMFLKRALIHPLMTVFDFTDTTTSVEQRDMTIVAPQALSLMNNPWIHARAEAMAARIEQEVGLAPEKQSEAAFRLGLGRSPSSEERRAAARYLARPHATNKGSNAAKRPAARLWLRADRGAETGPSGQVRIWRDQSGFGMDALQPSETAQPLLVKLPNGSSALRFDGTSDFLTIGEQILTGQQFAFVAVASDRAEGNGHREILSNWNREGNIGTSVFLGTTGRASVRFTDHFPSAGVLDAPEQLSILSAVSGEGEVVVYQNRSELSRVIVSMPPRNLQAPYVIGQQGNIGGEFWRGDIAEIIVFDRALSEAELWAVWDELGKRYGIAPAHPRPSAALASLCRILYNSNEFLFVD